MHDFIFVHIRKKKENSHLVLSNTVRHLQVQVDPSDAQVDAHIWRTFYLYIIITKSEIEIEIEIEIENKRSKELPWPYLLGSTAWVICR